MQRRAGGSVCILLILALAVVWTAPGARAQVLYGSIVGLVTDPTGAAIPRAHITLNSPQTNLKREADADDAGRYTIPNLPEGTYNITVTASGFKPLKQTDIQVKVGSVLRLDSALEVGALTEQVTVEASGALLQTEKSDVSTGFGTAPVENLPTGFYRNFQYLLVLVPGAAEIQGMTGALADTPERAIAVPMNGLGPASNSTRIDGAQSIFLWKPGGGALYIPPIESIQEVKVTTNSYEPEKGMAGSAAMDVITKSGTNDWHGTLFGYHFNQHFQSREAWDYSGQKKPKQILNDDGGNFGGPIKKDKLFFFANWDGVFERDIFNGLSTVPMPELHNGDFSKYLGAKLFNPDGTPYMVPTTDGHGHLGPMVQLQQGMVFDPTTGNPNGTGRAVFDAGGVLNAMPTDRFSPAAQYLLGKWPMPNFPGIVDAEGNVSQNYFLQSKQRFNRNNLDFKVDWNRTQKHWVWVKYSVMNSLTTATCGYAADIGGPCVGTDSPGTTHDLVQTATVGHTWTVTPSFVVDGNVGYSRMGIFGKAQDYGTNIGLDVLKIPGTNDPNDKRYSGMPEISVGGYDPLGNTIGWQPFTRNDWSFTNADNASLTHGSHTFRFGIDLIHNHMNHWQPENGFGPRGQINFTRGDAAFLNTKGIPLVDAKGATANMFETQYNRFASFLMGIWDEAGRTIQYQKMNGKDWEYGLHFLDRWKVTQRLTLNLGVRYEYYPLMRRDSLGKGLEQYDPTTNTVLLGGLGGNPVDLGVKTQKGLFAPRIGVAYELNNKTVIRAGFGSTFDTYPLLRELRGGYPAEIATDYTFDLSNPNTNTFQGLGTFAGGIPAVALPDVTKGTIPVDPSVGVRYVGKGTLKRGRIETWNVTVERKLPGELVLGVGYVGNRMSHGWGQIDQRASDIDQPGPLSQYGRTADTLQLQGYLDSHYNALQATLDRRFAKGLYIKAAYTYSKAIDMTSDESWGGGLWMAPTFAGPGYLQHNRGMADFDHRHIFRLAHVWELPFGKGHALAAGNPVARALLGGWQVNGIWDYTGGHPTTLYADNSNLRQIGNYQTVDQIGPLKKIGGLGPGKDWYDPSSFAPVPLGADGYQHRFGSTGRNIPIYSPGHTNLDAGIFRHFQIKERFDLQFRAEGLNVMNHPTWNFDNNLWGASNYCWDTSSGHCAGTFMQATNASGHRTIRLGLRLAF